LMNGHPVSDFTLAYPCWIIAIIAGQCIPYLLSLDAIALAVRMTGRWEVASAQSWLTVLLVLSTVAFVVARTYLDTRTIRVREETIRLQNLPKDLDGFRIAHISDVQADPRTDPGLLNRYAARVNALDVDVVMFAGDLVTRGTDHVAEGVNCLASMKARHGVYACLGDHDIWSAPRMITSGLLNAGVGLVEDGQVLLEVGEARVGVAVTTNAYSSRPDTDGGINPEGDVSILLTHQPSPGYVEIVGRAGYDLLLAGHTHGGQINLNWFGFRLNASAFETPYVSGLYRVGDLVLSVTNGLGLTLAPFRYLAPAEITLITLRPVS
jgi:predicted MPP superfamily phosphohydrolase